MTQPTINVHLWDKTAANNATSDFNWAENMNRQEVNNGVRADNAAFARYRDLLNATITTGGSANAQTFTSGHSYLVGDTIPTGFRARLKAGFTNTGAMTLAMDSVAAKNVKDVLAADPGPGAVIASHYFQVIFDGTNWVLERSQPDYATSTLAPGGSALATGIPLSLTSINLGPGEWDVRATATFAAASGTPVVAYVIGSVGTTITTVGPSYDGSSSYVALCNQSPFSFVSNISFPIGPYRLSLSAASTPVYLTSQVGYSSGLIGGFGNINARRIRT